MASILSDFVGHQQNLEHLRTSLREGHLANALILNGPSGIGKNRLVRGLLQEKLCQQGTAACGQCSHCQRVFETQNEFIYELSPQEKKTIGVDAVRDLMPFLSLQAVSEVRFVIVDPAEALTPQSANALLKVLEEPPERTHFFLITEKFSSLLPTIRSRCQIFNFQPLSPEQMSQVPGIVPEALPWASGRPAVGLYLSEKENLEQINQAYGFFYHLTQPIFVDWKKSYPDFFVEKRIQDLYFEVWQTCLQRKLRGQGGQDLEFLPNDESTLLSFYEGIQSAISDWNRNVDKVVVIENLFYHLQRSLKAPQETLWNSPITY